MDVQPLHFYQTSGVFIVKDDYLPYRFSYKCDIPGSHSGSWFFTSGNPSRATLAMSDQSRGLFACW